MLLAELQIMYIDTAPSEEVEHNSPLLECLGCTQLLLSLLQSYEKWGWQGESNLIVEKHNTTAAK